MITTPITISIVDPDLLDFWGNIDLGSLTRANGGLMLRCSPKVLQKTLLQNN